MLDRVLSEARSMPNRVSRRGRMAQHRAQVRFRHTRLEGQQRLWTLQVDALTQANELLERSPEVVGLRFLRTTAARAVERALDTATALPHGYADLNAKQAIKVVRDLEAVPLLRVRRWESEHKARKTVLAAMDKRQQQLQRVPEPVFAEEAGEE